MSLVPTWVLAQDGRYYKDPILRGEDWFLCFDDDDPPELVIKLDGRPDITTRAVEILNSLGFGYEIKSRRSFSERLFGGEFNPAAAYFLMINDPIPVPQESEQSATYDEAILGECVLYHFGRKP